LRSGDLAFRVKDLVTSGSRFGVWGLRFGSQVFWTSILGLEVQGFRVEELWFGCTDGVQIRKVQGWDLGFEVQGFVV
jgi:hypothetical protein